MLAAEAVPATATPAEAKPAAPAAEPLPAGATPKLVCIRGVRIGLEYPIYEGPNYLGRSDEQPVDIDLDDQERADNIWSSRQHALVTFENNCLFVEDLTSANGTYLNRDRLLPGQKQPVKVGDVIQIGGIHLKVQA
jgi:pSer/pThr/pTyr-binding forkhead associated (FHA) protein